MQSSNQIPGCPFFFILQAISLKLLACLPAGGLQLFIIPFSNFSQGLHWRILQFEYPT